jgi:putative flippase GtrA
MKALFRRHEKSIRFVLTGVWNTMLGYAVFAGLYALLKVRLNYVAILAISQIVAVSAAYLAYKRFVFKTSGSGLTEYLRFWTVYGYTFLLNLALLPLCVGVLRISPLAAQAGITALLALASYFGHDRFTFKAAA